ncbi:hypothetical protein [Desulfosporosinus fructosivorans]
MIRTFGSVLGIDSKGFDTGGVPALTGNAAVGDVVNGKTFYTTDAKTKLTGTGANAKRTATGTVTSSSGTMLIPMETGSNGSTYYVAIDLSALSFVPNYIVVRTTDQSKKYFQAIWSNNNHYYAGGGIEYANSWSNNVSTAWRVPYTNGIIYIPIADASTGMSWTAYE